MLPYLRKNIDNHSFFREEKWSRLCVLIDGSLIFRFVSTFLEWDKLLCSYSQLCLSFGSVWAQFCLSFRWNLSLFCLSFSLFYLLSHLSLSIILDISNLFSVSCLSKCSQFWDFHFKVLSKNKIQDLVKFSVSHRIVLWEKWSKVNFLRFDGWTLIYSRIWPIVQ